MYYVLKFKYKHTLTYGAFGWSLWYSLGLSICDFKLTI